jgi:hypothetical protein
VIAYLRIRLVFGVAVPLNSDGPMSFGVPPDSLGR